MVYFAGPIFEWWWEPLVILVFSAPFILASIATWAILKYVMHKKSKHLLLKSFAVWVLIGLLVVSFIGWYFSQ